MQTLVTMVEESGIIFFILTLENIIIPLSYEGTIKRYVVMSIIS